MAKDFNLWKYITSQIASNLKDNLQETISVSQRNKDEAIVIINNLQRNGGLKVVSIKNEGNEFLVKYRDLNLDIPQLRGLLKYDKSLNQLEYNNKVRYDEWLGYSTPYLTEIDGAYLGDGSKFEMEDPFDNPFTEWIINEKGWKDKAEFINSFIDYSTAKDMLAEYEREFYSNPERFAKEYEYNDVIDEEPAY